MGRLPDPEGPEHTSKKPYVFSDNALRNLPTSDGPHSEREVSDYHSARNHMRGRSDQNGVYSSNAHGSRAQQSRLYAGMGGHPASRLPLNSKM